MLQHLAFVNFGLEASVLRISATDFAEITAPKQDIPGPNSNPSKAEKMRSFELPERFKDPDSSDLNKLRRINIFMAIECDDDTVWLFLDFARLIRFHIVSRGRPWTANCLQADSLVSLRRKMDKL